MMKLAILMALTGVIAIHPLHAATGNIALLEPSRADTRVTQFNDPNVVIEPSAGGGDVPLVIFLPGTGGKPQNLMPLLQTAASQGYRVLGLSYDDTPAVEQVCPRDPDPACSLRFRSSRLSSDVATPVMTPAEDAIITRIRMALRELATEHPQAWTRYLTDDGEIVWSKIVVGGFSQGAGMAALIGKRFAVRRVVLFSGPWDTTGPGRNPAPWLSQPAATPPDRWRAARHARENTTNLLSHAYRALAIPEQQIIVFDSGFPEPMGPNDNPAHRSTVRRLEYLPDWKAMFGRP